MYVPLDSISPDELSECQTLAEGVDGAGRAVRLTRIGPGYVRAGAFVRWTDGYYAVAIDGDRLLQPVTIRYSLEREGEARERFNRITLK